MGKSFARDAGVIPRADRSAALLTWQRNIAGHSRFVPGWICPTSAIPLVEFRSISRIVKATSVCCSTQRNFTLMIFLIPGTFHPKRWSLSSPRCPASKHSTLYSNPLDLALTGKSKVCPYQNALYSFSRHFSFQRRYQIFRGTRDQHRHPSTRPKFFSIKSILTAHDLPNSLILHQSLGHLMKHMCKSMMRYPTSRSDSDIGHLSLTPTVFG